MNRFKTLILITATTALLLSGCGNNSASMDHPVRLMDYVLDLGVIKDYDEKKMMDFCKEKYFVPSEFGCSCVVTQVDGKNIVGRNNDITITENSCFKFILDINQYKALGLCYCYQFQDKLSYEYVLNNGLDDFSKMIIPFVATDYLNEKGLYIQTDMRYEEDGYEVTSTNPKSDVDLFLMSFPGYAATRCKNVYEAVGLAMAGVNIYNNVDPSKTVTWNFAFTLADAEGNYGLLEVAKNKVSFLPKQNGQANYYVTPEFAKDAKFQSGEPRFKVLNEGLDQVKTLDNMLKHMEKTYYTWSSEWDKLDEAPYDVRTECVGCFPVDKDGKVSLDGDTKNCTTAWLMDEKNKDYVFDIIKTGNKELYSTYKNNDGTWNYPKLRKAYGTIPDFWITMFSVAVDCSARKMKVRYFQDSTKEIEFSI